MRWLILKRNCILHNDIEGLMTQVKGVGRRSRTQQLEDSCLNVKFLVDEMSYQINICYLNCIKSSYEIIVIVFLIASLTITKNLKLLFLHDYFLL